MNKCYYTIDIKEPFDLQKNKVIDIYEAGKKISKIIQNHEAFNNHETLHEISLRFSNIKNQEDFDKTLNFLYTWAYTKIPDMNKRLCNIIT